MDQTAATAQTLDAKADKCTGEGEKGLSRLSSAVIRHTARFLDAKSTGRLLSTCHTCRTVLMADQQLWRQLFLVRWAYGSDDDGDDDSSSGDNTTAWARFCRRALAERRWARAECRSWRIRGLSADVDVTALAITGDTLVVATWPTHPGSVRPLGVVSRLSLTATTGGAANAPGRAWTRLWDHGAARVTALACNMRWVVAGDQTGTVRLWPSESGTASSAGSVRLVLPHASVAPALVALSRHHLVCAQSGGHGLSLVDLRQWPPRPEVLYTRTRLIGTPSIATLSLDGVSAGEPRECACFAAVEFEEGPARFCAVDPATRQLLLCEDPRSERLWSLAQRAAKRLSPGPQTLSAVCARRTVVRSGDHHLAFARRSEAPLPEMERLSALVHRFCAAPHNLALHWRFAVVVDGKPPGFLVLDFGSDA